MVDALDRPNRTEIKIDGLENLRVSLEIERASWDLHWKDLAEACAPRRPQWLVNDSDRRAKKQHGNIVDNTFSLAWRVLRAGLHAGMTSPARPWFEIAVEDAPLRMNKTSRIWLDIVEQQIRNTFLKSNVYHGLPMMYGDMGLFGTASSVLQADREDIVRLYSFPIGQWSLALDDRQKVDTIVRKFSMTVRQMVEKFGLDRLSQGAKDVYEHGNLENKYAIIHDIVPNKDYNPNGLYENRMKWLSVWYEESDHDNKALRVGGFLEFPGLCPRWESHDGDTYGESPGMLVLGDSASLQVQQKRKGLAIEKDLNPSMVAPAGMTNTALSLLPGALNFAPQGSNAEIFRPTHVPQTDISKVLEDIGEHHVRIEEGMHKDLFLMLASRTGPQMTAREVAERHEEKLVMLGPVLEGSEEELLAPMVIRTYNELGRRERLPPPPPQIADAGLKIQFVSILATAQKLVGVTALDRFVSFAAGVASQQVAAGQDPTAWDKVDVDETIDVYADLTGVRPSIVIDTEEAEETRAARQAALAEQQQMQQGIEAAGAAKDLSQADTGGQNALTDLMGSRNIIGVA